jgi:hypothetical protein
MNGPRLRRRTRETLPPEDLTGLRPLQYRERRHRAAPSPSTIPRAPVAQWIEHRPSKPRVAGSTPAGRANLRSVSSLASDGWQGSPRAGTTPAHALSESRVEGSRESDSCVRGVAAIV